jgi:hypothetical protein
MKTALLAIAVAAGLAGCTVSTSTYYYCWAVILNHPDGRQLNALECVPRAQKVPWDPAAPPGRELFQ